MASKINVYRVRDGVKVEVPAHWMDNPHLSKHFRKTPKTKASESADSGSSTSAPNSAASRGSNKP